MDLSYAKQLIHYIVFIFFKLKLSWLYKIAGKGRRNGNKLSGKLL